MIGTDVDGWTIGARANGTELITLHIFVAQPDSGKAELERRLFLSSDPTSPQYGQHMSFDEVNRLLKPSPDALRAIRSWLTDNGVNWSEDARWNPAQDIVEVTMPVASAERLIDAKYHYISQAAGDGSSRPVLRTARFTLPASVQGFVDVVGPTTRLPKRSFQAWRPQDLTSGSAAQFTTPADLRAQYGASGVSSTSKNNSFALAGFLDAYFAQSDIDYFFSNFDKASVGKQVLVHGSNSPGLPSGGIESTLDVSYGAAMAAGVPTTFWNTDGRMPGHTDNEPWLQWLSDVSGDPAPPLVFSISYSDNENTVDSSYAKRMNVEFQKAGARGITIIDSSGDGGVSGTQPDNFCKKFQPTFPSSSPFVTAVGGTSGAKVGEETASTVFPSGGGFSTFQDRPSYQKEVVAKYLASASGIPSQTLFSSENAGYPDVSMRAENFVLTQFGIDVPVSGTSCSAPSFGGLVALLNDIRLKAGQPSLGWLNPLLYSHPEAFNDITKGSNPGCAVDASVGYLGEGFPAATGWDPVTGLGTPKFAAWQAIVEALPKASPMLIVSV